MIIQPLTYKAVSVDDEYAYTWSALHCPHCDNQFLHHRSVTVFDRAEDQAMVRRTRVGTAVAVDEIANAASGNPSGRRDGLSISFWCEQCSAGDGDRILELTILQHKGTTFLEWRYDDC